MANPWSGLPDNPLYGYNWQIEPSSIKNEEYIILFNEGNLRASYNGLASSQDRYAVLGSTFQGYIYPNEGGFLYRSDPRSKIMSVGYETVYGQSQPIFIRSRLLHVTLPPFRENRGYESCPRRHFTKKNLSGTMSNEWRSVELSGSVIYEIGPRGTWCVVETGWYKEYRDGKLYREGPTSGVTGGEKFTQTVYDYTATSIKVTSNDPSTSGYLMEEFDEDSEVTWDDLVSIAEWAEQNSQDAFCGMVGSSRRETYSLAYSRDLYSMAIVSGHVDRGIMLSRCQIEIDPEMYQPGTHFLVSFEIITRESAPGIYSFPTPRHAGLAEFEESVSWSLVGEMDDPEDEYGPITESSDRWGQLGWREVRGSPSGFTVNSVSRRLWRIAVHDGEGPFTVKWKEIFGDEENEYTASINKKEPYFWTMDEKFSSTNSTQGAIKIVNNVQVFDKDNNLVPIGDWRFHFKQRTGWWGFPEYGEISDPPKYYREQHVSWKRVHQRNPQFNEWVDKGELTEGACQAHLATITEEFEEIWGARYDPHSNLSFERVGYVYYKELTNSSRKMETDDGILDLDFAIPNDSSLARDASLRPYYMRGSDIITSKTSAHETRLSDQTIRFFGFDYFEPPVHNQTTTIKVEKKQLVTGTDPVSGREVTEPFVIWSDIPGTHVSIGNITVTSTDLSPPSIIPEGSCPPHCEEIFPSDSEGESPSESPSEDPSDSSSASDSPSDAPSTSSEPSSSETPSTSETPSSSASQSGGGGSDDPSASGSVYESPSYSPPESPSSSEVDPSPSGPDASGEIIIVSKEGCSTICGFTPNCGPGAGKDYYTHETLKQFDKFWSPMEPEYFEQEFELVRQMGIDEWDSCSAECVSYESETRSWLGDGSGEPDDTSKISGCEYSNYISPPSECTDPSTWPEGFTCTFTESCGIPGDQHEEEVHRRDNHTDGGYIDFNYTRTLSGKIEPTLPNSECPKDSEGNYIGGPQGCYIVGSDPCTFLEYLGEPEDPEDPCSKNKGPTYCRRDVTYSVKFEGLDPNCTYEIRVSVSRTVICTGSSSTQDYTLATVSGVSSYQSSEQSLPVEEGVNWCIESAGAYLVECN